MVNSLKRSGQGSVAIMLQSIVSPTTAVVECDRRVEESFLHPEEAACVRRSVEKRRLEFSAGRFCARMALSQLGVHDFSLLPDADRVPLWPPGVVGSISHCSGLAVAAVARSESVKSIGVDVEPPPPPPRCQCIEQV